MSVARLLSSSQLNTAIVNHLDDGRLVDAVKLFCSNSHLRNTASWNLMLAGYIRNGRPQCARKLFDEMPCRDIVSWNTILSGFRRSGDSFMAFQHFSTMILSGLRPSGVTLTTMITIFQSSNLLVQLHGMAIRTGLSLNSIVGTALVGGYAGLRDPIAMFQAFKDIPIKNSVSWTSLMLGYMEFGRLNDAERVFEAMPVKNVVSWTAMINGCISNGNLNAARRYFDQMPIRNVITWTSMIKGYQQNEQQVNALNLFAEMLRLSSVRPNQFTYSTVLAACAGCCSLLFGKSVHGQILKSQLLWDVILSSSLVEMYGKCGDVDSATQSFESFEIRNVVSWNSIIGCYARHGLSTRALEKFKEMIQEGVRPDDITFVCVLMACVHGGLVEEGEYYLELMEREFCIKPRLEHYGCMVDLLGRAGQIDRAEDLIKQMPFEPDTALWGAFLSACGWHLNLEHGLWAAKAMQRLEMDHPAIYSMMLRVYGERGAWRRVNGLKEKMEKVVVGKQMGLSWVDSAAS
ncbi:Pentatricopeptide repeat-containing protein [Canna indica]|uniref:Pentatricopeptide repeat-containing protein n=1 Tax=Canna indica TaxID=4628 RepID=A0AAQ3L9C2_9LILI|nr:Pentatricopeptide repeat-containing protein [Canna indica]